jgi:hypothetical protein
MISNCLLQQNFKIATKSKFELNFSKRIGPKIKILILLMYGLEPKLEPKKNTWLSKRVKLGLTKG